MLGVEYQTINCNKRECSHIKRNIIYDGDDKIVEVYYTCEKETINLDGRGQCTDGR